MIESEREDLYTAFHFDFGPNLRLIVPLLCLRRVFDVSTDRIQDAVTTLTSGTGIPSPQAASIERARKL